MRLLPTLLALAPAGLLLATTPAAAFDILDMTDAERAALRNEIHTYLVENPEILIDMSRTLEERQMAAQTVADRDVVAKNAALIFDDDYSFVGGNPEGDLTLVEFLDYRCGYCKKAHHEVADLVSQDGNIRYVVKELPILGEESLLASRFAIAALKVAGPEAYAKINAGFYEDFRGAVTPETLKAFATGLGITPEPILAAMEGEDIDRILIENRRLAETLSIRGTPAFVIGGQLVHGYVPPAAMVAAVTEERALAAAGGDTGGTAAGSAGSASETTAPAASDAGAAAPAE